MALPHGQEPKSDEKAALREVRAGRIIKTEMKQRLVKAGLINEALGGLALTPSGEFWAST